MKVTKSDIVISAVKPEQYPSGGLPEIALAGRSNVGKSSFINSLINRKNLARTSSKPGKTRRLIFTLLMICSILWTSQVMALQKYQKQSAKHGGE